MNYGIDIAREIAEQSPKDWKFGALSEPCIAEIPEGERDGYLPTGEVQMGVEDMCDCASRAPVNIFAAKFTYAHRNKLFSVKNLAWLEDNDYVVDGRIDFSDAFVAINSCTTRHGNSLKAPLESIRTQGLIPKAMLPLEPWMTFDSYHDPRRITKRLIDLGKEFTRRFTTNYEQVDEVHYGELLKTDFIDVAAFAWPLPINGEYPRVQNVLINHAFMLYKTPRYYAFDNYIDSVDGDFIKKLAINYDFWEYGYRAYISRDNDIEAQIDLLRQLVALYTTLLAALLKNRIVGAIIRGLQR